MRYFRRATEAEELSREQQQHVNRSVTYWYDYDGSLILRARLPAATGALLVKAIETAQEQIAQEHVSAETPDCRCVFAARRADAVAVVAQSFLKQDPPDGADRTQVVVHVDAAMLAANAPGRCEIEDAPAISAETARRLSCDASVVAIIEGERGEPLDIGRKTRSIPPALRRALNSRDRGCRFPGCPNKRYVDGHHIRHWAAGGETKLSNLVTLCRFHHRQVHEGRVVVRMLDDGALRFTKPSGDYFDSVAAGCTPPLGDWTELVAGNQALGLRIDQQTAVTRWLGERMDYNVAIETLLFQARRASGVSAETR